jgi:hypothetical protein
MQTTTERAQKKELIWVYFPAYSFTLASQGISAKVIVGLF